MSEQEAGRNMDAEIATRVFGWTRVTTFEPRPGLTLNHGFPPDGQHQFGAVPPSYSTDIAAAWTVVENMEARGWRVVTRSAGPVDGMRRVEVDVPHPKRRGSYLYAANAPTVPLAICRAALAAAHPEGGE